MTILLHACGGRKNSEPALFQLMENTGIGFSNDVQQTKDFNILTFRNFYNGGGVAIGDVNNDGLADVFFTANMGGNRLYLNKGNWQFEDISVKAGFPDKEQWSTGTVMVDINHDGWLDIFVANSGHINDGVSRANQLFINNRNVTFTDSAEAYGLNDSGYTTHASFFDYDLDGDLDCFLVNNSPIPVNTLNYANKRDVPEKEWAIADYLKGGGDHLLRNDNGKFVEVTRAAGIHGGLISLGLGVTVGDVNNDNYPDIYVSNDFFERDYLYINQQNGTFKDRLEDCMQHTSLASMGADIADINNDGYPDIFTTDMLPDDDYRLKTTSSFDNIDVYRLKEKNGFYHQYMQNTLQLNNRNGEFMDIAQYSGVAASDWSWGALMFDADNDGLTDLYVCNGIYLDVTDQDFIDFFANDVIQRMVMTGNKEEVDSILKKMPSHPLVNKVYKNEGNLKFTDAAEKWGFKQASFSNGAAYGDLDNDGDLDLVVSNVNQPAFVYRNRSREIAKNHYLGVVLKGNDKNTFAVGSKVNVYAGGQVISREVMPSRGFQSSMDYKLVIGLGQAQQIDSMVITWPDRSVTKYENPAIDTVLTVMPSAMNILRAANTTLQPNAVVPLFTSLNSPFEKHREDDHIDFYYERNIPRMLSREGPKAACGDVNGDGLTDIYIGGATGQGGQLYLQTKTGGFIKKEEQLFKQMSDFEDAAVLFFDCDNDKDLDLFVGAGGNNVPENQRQLQHRLYINDGKGNFDVHSAAFPTNNMNISTVAGNDFDADGDIDLFVGALNVPYNYGITPVSYLYVNDGKGHFTDMAREKNPDIAHIGMVTGAVWTDLTGDRQKELVIVGEWMAPRIFSWAGGRFKEVKTDLVDLFGWWKTVAATDIDGDGDEDLLLGNMGENFYLHPSKQDPVKMWINDFDQNGSIEKIITRSIERKDKPVFLKREMTDQQPSLKKQNLQHREFAKKSVQELFDAEQIDKATVKQINYASSCIAVNEGNGKFTIQELPVPVQFSCVNTIKCTDINNDGKTDLILGGNEFTFQPQFGRLDACAVTVLLNTGSKGRFQFIDARQSGLQVNGAVKDIAEIKGANTTYYIILQNDSYPALYVSKTTK
ncbi:VCBS repeat-containing protein [Longitalea luteola]|uniref:VCBS repeat-containing protein n=1 Tax=Longitalea luteola TaxID=2812563 RepID=UPI001F606887|nr:VCBS repeat-containing protein [Longitalea luteola]